MEEKKHASCVTARVSHNYALDLNWRPSLARHSAMRAATIRHGQNRHGAELGGDRQSGANLPPRNTPLQERSWTISTPP